MRSQHSHFRGRTMTGLFLHRSGRSWEKSRSKSRSEARRWSSGGRLTSVRRPQQVGEVTPVCSSCEQVCCECRGSKRVSVTCHQGSLSGGFSTPWRFWTATALRGPTSTTRWICCTTGYLGQARAKTAMRWGLVPLVPPRSTMWEGASLYFGCVISSYTSLSRCPQTTTPWWPCFVNGRCAVSVLADTGPWWWPSCWKRGRLK